METTVTAPQKPAHKRRRGPRKSFGQRWRRQFFWPQVPNTTVKDWPVSVADAKVKDEIRAVGRVMQMPVERVQHIARLYMEMEAGLYHFWTEDAHSNLPCPITWNLDFATCAPEDCGTFRDERFLFPEISDDSVHCDEVYGVRKSLKEVPHALRDCVQQVRSCGTKFGKEYSRGIRYVDMIAHYNNTTTAFLEDKARQKLCDESDDGSSTATELQESPLPSPKRACCAAGTPQSESPAEAGLSSGLQTSALDLSPPAAVNGADCLAAMSTSF